MTKRTGPTDIYLDALIRDLRRKTYAEKVNIWKKIATELEKPRRNKRPVNLSKINKYAKENDIVLVPGKVLASGDLSMKLVISSFAISSSALEKIRNASCTYMTIPELVNKNPSGKNIRIIC